VPARGPEANARLTAITGAVLLVLLAIEGVTLLSLRSLISWHIFVGVLVVPVVGLKLASTGWKFAKYYLRRPDYVRVGPPHVLLRMLGPLVVVSTLALLASGLALIAVGPQGGVMLLLHKASFVVWFGALGVHVIAHLPRLAPALRGEFLLRDRLRGRAARIVLVTVSIGVGALAAALVLPHDASWLHWMRVRVDR
jgi:hypothetical protein